MFHSYPKSRSLGNAFSWWTILCRIALGLAIVCALAIVFFALRADAASNTIPERNARNCTVLGYPTPNCEIKFSRNHTAKVWITVDENVSEPPWAHVVPGARATTLFIKTRRGVVTNTYQSSEAPGLRQLTDALQRPPCLTEAQTEAREEDPTHVCLAEQDFLNDVGTALSKLIGATPDAAISERLRSLYNKEGLPIVRKLKRVRVSEEADNDLGSAAWFKVRWAFGQPYAP